MKLQKILLIFSLLAAISLKAQTNSVPQVIPSIQQWEGKTGYFTFSENTPLIVDKNFPQLESYISVFSNDLQSLYNFKAEITLAQAKSQSVFNRGCIFLKNLVFAKHRPFRLSKRQPHILALYTNKKNVENDKNKRTIYYLF